MPASRDAASEPQPEDLGDIWFCIFEFVHVRELGRLQSCCHAWRVLPDLMWHILYERTQHDATTMDVAERPVAHDAVGWNVSVFDETTETWQPGRVIGYANDRYHVAYRDGERWEQDQRTNGPWHSRGKTRFFFVSNDGGASPPAAPELRGACKRGALADAEPSSSRSKASPGRGVDEPIVRNGSWCEEMKQNVLQLPQREAATLRDHTDEVLDLQFSHDGLRLATCSRDFTTLIYEIELGSPADASCAAARDTTRRGRHEAMDVGPMGLPPVPPEAPTAAPGAVVPPPPAPVSVPPPAGAAPDEELAEDAAGDAQMAGVVSLALFETSNLSAVVPTSQDTRFACATTGGVHATRPTMTFRPSLKLRRPADSSCVCRVLWSPDDAYLLACTEEPQGNPFGHGSAVELWEFNGPDPTTGRAGARFVGMFPSTPFDIHANWCGGRAAPFQPSTFV